MKKFVILLVCVFAINAMLVAECEKTESSSLNQLDLLIPKSWVSFFPKIEVAIPKTYIGVSYDKNFEKSSKILWGEKKDVQRYLKDMSIDKPIFHVEVASAIKQTGPNSFSGESLLVDAFKEQGMLRYDFHRLQWGEYPVAVFEGYFPNNVMTRWAIIGLNNSGKTLLVVIFSPKADEKIGEPQTKRIWNDFIKNTTSVANHTSNNLVQTQAGEKPE